MGHRKVAMVRSFRSYRERLYGTGVLLACAHGQVFGPGECISSRDERSLITEHGNMGE